MSRAEQARQLCARLTRAVDEFAPPGLGKWPAVWDRTAAPDRAFTMALAAWEASGARADRERLETAYDELLGAWRDAARDYLAEVAP